MLDYRSMFLLFSVLIYMAILAGKTTGANPSGTPYLASLVEDIVFTNFSFFNLYVFNVAGYV